VQFVAARYLDEVSGSFDAIAANPPYVPDTERNALGPTLAHEPEVALFGGPSGLRTIEGVLDTATSKLSPGGRLLMEIGMGQADAVRALVARMSALRLERIREDLQGIPRTAVVRRTSST
jgi:release factor glutamine methyltransferase